MFTRKTAKCCSLFLLVFRRMMGLIFIIFSMGACGYNSSEEFQEEGEAIMSTLIKELHQINRREELLVAQDRLERYFEKLADLMIMAQKFHNNPVLKKNVLSTPLSDLNEQLRIELARIYQIDGGRLLIEKIQYKALQKLVLFEKQNQL